MRLIESYRVRLAIGAALTGFGTSKFLAQLFLANWQVLSAGQSDIAARGVWLLAMFLPEFAIASVGISLLMVVALARRTGRPLVERLILGAVGGAAGALVIFLGADPTVLVLNLVRWPSSLAYYVVSAGVAVAIIVLGFVVTVQVARTFQIRAAAA